MTGNTSTVINLLGFITSTALYTMLLMMVLKPMQMIRGARSKGRPPINCLLLLTAILGILWNIGALAIYGLPNWGFNKISLILTAAAFTTLGFLPAVVVHLALRVGTVLDKYSGPIWLVVSAYSLSVIAGLLHFYVVIVGTPVPSHIALHILTIGFISLIIILLFLTRGQTGWQRTLWVVALSVFAVSASHFSHHTEGSYPWWVELASHHASLPLVLAILYQDYRFALADIFLKRALTLVLLVGITFGLYLIAIAPLLTVRLPNGETDPYAIGLLLTLWIVTALLYPMLRYGVVKFVDGIILRHVNYDELRTELVRSIAVLETPETILDDACRRLAPALSADQIRWLIRKNTAPVNDADKTSTMPLLVGRADLATQDRLEDESTDSSFIQRATTVVMIPTSEQPQYFIVIGELVGGRRLFSDDIALLENVAFLIARRIDAVRAMHDRCRISLREQEISKLATEAELRALRSQINPHFLFNALTTIAHLIQTAPASALETLMRLSTLLRGVLQRSASEFTTLGEEIELIKSYLDIEKARFEERLRLRLDVPSCLEKIRIPALIIQPLVENAIKHGINPSKAGGELLISTRLDAKTFNNAKPTEILIISVRDTGVGASEIKLARGRKRGVGLANIERRLKCYYGNDASLTIKSAPGSGTVVELCFPINILHTDQLTLDSGSENKEEWTRNFVL